METRERLIRRAYEILGDAVPLDYDCGELCGRRCCHGDSNTGMWVLPGEKALLGGEYTVFEAEDGQATAVCGGNCERGERPFSCRIFPMFPQIRLDAEGQVHVKAAFDPRAMASCPIAAGSLPVKPSFKRAVRRAARVLMQDETLRNWLIDSGEFLDGIAALREKLGE